MESYLLEFKRLVEIMDELREKCPWDKKQTIHSLRQLTLEEVYELTGAITDKDWKAIKEELGDLLLHILFYAKIGSEEQQFTLTEVINDISSKLVARHPHVYATSVGEQLVQVKGDEDVKKNWENLKLKEGNTSVLSGVPTALPALIKAMRLQEKAKQVGFEWENREQVWVKVQEEIEEMQEAIVSENNKNIEEEFGDVLFSMVNFARFLNIDAENALEITNKKFIYRFNLMEQKAGSIGKNLSNLSLTEMDTIWNEIKQEQV